MYRFHEEIVETIRALLHEGFTGIILTSEERKPYSKNFWITSRSTIDGLIKESL